MPTKFTVPKKLNNVCNNFFLRMILITIEMAGKCHPKITLTLQPHRIISNKYTKRRII